MCRLLLCEFGKDTFVQAHPCDDRTQADLKVALVVCDLLFAEIQFSRDFLVGQAAHEEHLDRLQFGPSITTFPARDLFGDRVTYSRFIDLFAHDAAGDRAGNTITTDRFDLTATAATATMHLDRWPATLAAQVIG
jgi:hypothetical protein